MKSMFSVFVLLVAATLVHGEDKKPVKNEKLPTVSGLVKKIDDKANSVTLAIGGQKGQPAEERTFTLAADATIVVLGKEVKLAEVIADKTATLKLSADNKVMAVTQESTPVTGLVKKVDEKANTVTLSIAAVKGQPAEDQTFTLAAEAKIVVEGKKVGLAEVVADKPATLRFNADKKAVALVQETAPVKGEKGEGVTGLLKKVDATANTVTLTIVSQKGQPAEDKVFTLNADTKIVVFGKDGKLTDLVIEKVVSIKLNTDKKVVAVSQEKPPIYGMLKSIDEKTNTVTLAVITTKGQPAEDKTFTLAAEAKIVSQGSVAKLKELATDKPAVLTLNGDNKVTALNQGGKKVTDK